MDWLAILLMWLNSVRAEPLAYDEQLATDAQRWATVMDSDKVLRHGLEQASYGFLSGEIVGRAASPDAVGSAFIYSPEHLAIIQAFPVVGCGKSGAYYACRFRDAP